MRLRAWIVLALIITLFVGAVISFGTLGLEAQRTW